MGTVKTLVTARAPSGHSLGGSAAALAASLPASRSPRTIRRCSPNTILQSIAALDTIAVNSFGRPGGYMVRIG